MTPQTHHLHLLLRAPGDLVLEHGPGSRPDNADVPVAVSACGICGTDFKMWREGHPTLRLPRVLGHEIVGVRTDTSKPVAVWPGRSCGQCLSCRNGHENLCGQMRILGFHVDGGWSQHVWTPPGSLLDLPPGLDPALATLAEPLACAFNGWDQTGGPAPDEPVLIVGGGILGLLLAWIARRAGASVSVAEIQHEQRSLIRPFIESISAILAPDTIPDASASICFTAAPGTKPAQTALRALLPGGTWGFFCGLPPSETTPASLWNPVHYRQLHVTGSYGCTRAQMQKSLQQLMQFQSLSRLLLGPRLSLRELARDIGTLADQPRLKAVVIP
jgi:threonine dehydrogenase-like Zn-dependent dehydrogenase